MIIVLVSKCIYTDTYIYFYKYSPFENNLRNVIYLLCGRDNNFQDHFVRIDIFNVSE